jgi:hypothetical protein
LKPALSTMNQLTQSNQDLKRPWDVILFDGHGPMDVPSVNGYVYAYYTFAVEKAEQPLSKA